MAGTNRYSPLAMIVHEQQALVIDQGDACFVDIDQGDRSSCFDQPRAKQRAHGARTNDHDIFQGRIST